MLNLKLKVAMKEPSIIWTIAIPGDSYAQNVGELYCA